MEIIAIACAAFTFAAVALTCFVLVNNQALLRQVENLQTTLADRDHHLSHRLAEMDSRLTADVERFGEVGAEIARVGYANIASVDNLMKRMVALDEGDESEAEPSAEQQQSSTSSVFSDAERELHARVLAELSAMAKQGNLTIPDNKLRLLTAIGTLTALHSVALVVGRVTKLHLQRADELLAAEGIGEPSSERAPKARNAALRAFVRGDTDAEGSLSSFLNKNVVEGLFEGAGFTGKPDNDMPDNSGRPTPPAV